MRIPCGSHWFIGGLGAGWVRMLFSRAAAYAVLFSLLFVAAIYHLSRLTTDTVHGEFLKSPDTIVQLVKQARDKSGAPVASDAVVYFETIVLIDQADGQCQLLQRMAGHGVRGGVVPIGFEEALRVCNQFIGSGLMAGDTMYRYHQVFDGKAMDEAQKRYAAEHPGWNDPYRRSQFIETTWYEEEILYFYVEGMGIALCIFLLRLHAQGFNLWLEAVMGRLAVAVLLWPAALFAYRGDPRQQLRDLLRVITFMATSTLSLVCPIAVKAASPMKKAEGEQEPVTLSWGGSIQTKSVFNNGFEATPGPVVQPWMEVGFPSTGWYVGSWASFGLETSVGQEIDLSVGRRMESYGVKFDLSYNYYRFLPLREGMHVPQVVVCGSGGFCGKVLLLAPDTGAQSGSQAGVWWSGGWSHRIGTSVGVYHTRKVYGSEPVTILKGEVSGPIGESRVSWFLTGFKRLFGADPGDDDPKVVTGLRFAF